MKIQTLLLLLLAIVATSLSAIHAPGQMSVDSVAALYEGATGRAIGWGPTFFSAFLKWLGGGVVGSSLFVALNCIATYGCFAAILTSSPASGIPRWQKISAWILVFNPVFMFYVGIVWKDVLLTTVAIAASTCLMIASGSKGRLRYILIFVAALLIPSLTLIRQQGILVAAPLSIALAVLAAKAWVNNRPMQVIVFVMSLLVIAVGTRGLDALSSQTIKPQAHSPVSVGLLTIQAYDIAGMIRYSSPGDTSQWSNASGVARGLIKKEYSAQRIDTIWHVPEVRDYFNSLSAAQYTSIWLAGIEHDPMAYLRHRIEAFSYLLGVRSIVGCVPAYWGVAGVPDEMDALGFREEMDGRARLIGHTALRLYSSPVFRNWFYALLLIVATTVCFFKFVGELRFVGTLVSVAAWLYLLSFIPTTIACDVRYLYPVAGLSSLLCVFVLSRQALVNSSSVAGGSSHVLT